MIVSSPRLVSLECDDALELGLKSRVVSSLSLGVLSYRSNDRLEDEDVMVLVGRVGMFPANGTLK